MRSPGNIVKLVFLFSMSLLFFVGCKQPPETAETAESVDVVVASENDVNMIAPNFSLKTLDDASISLSDYKGKVVVIHMATTWCPFCNAEAPYLEALYQDYKNKNVEVLLIDVKEPKELVQEKLKEKYNLSFPILLDLDGAVASSYAPKDVLPELDRAEVMLASNIIIDKEGNIKFMSLLDSKNFDAELLQLKKRLNELL
jgi:peroxiredoxin